MTDTNTIRAQSLEALRQGQDTFVKAVQAWSENVAQFVPATPMNEMFDQLPHPHEVIDSVFDFTEGVLAVQREFAYKLLDATAPAMNTAARNVEAAQQAGEEG
jgi:hypothetical protein